MARQAGQQGLRLAAEPPSVRPQKVMSARAFYRFFALVPIAVPLVLLAIAWAGHTLPTPLAILGFSAAGLPFYVPFAVVIFWLLRHREARDHRLWSYWAPVAFAGLIFCGWFIFIVPGFSLAERLSKSGGASLYALVLGYIYVAAMHGAFLFACHLGAIRPESAPTGSAAA